MATTGSILDAWRAGMSPEIIPTATDQKTPVIILDMERVIAKLETLVMINNTIPTKMSPIAPPMMHRITASIRNSSKIIIRFAPNAFFMPIILVLSLRIQT